VGTVATSLVLVAACGIWATVIRPVSVNYRTATGEKRIVTLADRSTVQLNTETTLSVTWTQNVRRLILHDGEVFFTVALRPGSPLGSRSWKRHGPGIRNVIQRPGTRRSHHRNRRRARGQVGTRAAAVAESRAEQHVTHRTDDGLGKLERPDVHRALAWQHHRIIFEHLFIAVWPVSSLLGDDVWNVVSWVALGGPVAVVLLHMTMPFYFGWQQNLGTEAA